MQKQLLIITNKQDYTADFLIKRLQERKIEYVRINTEEFPQKIYGTVSINSEGNKILLGYKTSYLSINSISGIWYRRPVKPEIKNLTKQDKEFAERESSEFLLNIWHLLYEKLWVNNPTALIKAERKLVQLEIASKIGLEIPDTIVSNQIVEIKKFTDKYKNDVIVKPISCGDYNESSFAIFTSSIAENIDKLNKENIEISPFIIQNKINKIADIRISVFGRSIFAFKLITEQNILDWRKLNPDEIEYQVIELPLEIEKKIRAIMHELSLKFCVFDFALSRTNQWIFLEINPNGQWAWLEQITGIKMSDALIDLLMSNGKK